jgi:protein-disulfide isomerase/uncharacterized membrane protein
MREHVKRALVVILLAAVGLGISVVIEIIHARLEGDRNYASFCNVSAAVNCDTVLTSRYAELFGMPVSRWAIIFYAVVMALGIAVARTDRPTVRETLARIILILQVWGLLYAVYLALIAFAVLHTVCLMCSSLYVVSVALFAAAWWLRSSSRAVGRRQRAESARQDRMVLIGSAVAVLLVLVIGGWQALGSSGHTRATNPEEIARLRPEFYQWFFKQPVIAVPIDGSHTLGNADAPVTVVEFSDFECGHCFTFHRSLEDVLRTSGQNLRVVFRHFPLDSSCNPTVSSHLHQQACLAAAAAECAAEQGKFWQYHNLLFDNQDALGREFLLAYAQRLGMDTARFANCLGGSDARARVERDARAGAQLGIDSTPTWFINGRMIKGALEPDQLADALVLAQVKR